VIQQLNENNRQKQAPKQSISPEWQPAQTSKEVIRQMQEMKSWSQLDSSSFTPIVSVERFFNEDLLLPDHELAASPCYPIINFRPAGKYLMYCCEVCRPVFENINISSLEQHCRFYNTDQHESEIISRVHQSKKVIKP
jgi:hypothetical protein